MKIHKLCMTIGVVFTIGSNAGTIGDVDLWTGPYLGAHFGAGAGTIVQSFSDQSTSIQRTLPASQSITINSGSGRRQGNASGANLDVFVGYNVHPYVERLLLSGQFEGTLFNSVSMKAIGTRYGQSLNNFYNNSILTSASRSLTVAQSEMTTDLEALFSFVGRVGFLARPNTLIYALAGATEGNFRRAEGSSGSAGGSATGAIVNQWKLGVSVGGGLEYKLTEHWSLLGEYRYLNFKFNQNANTTSNSSNVNLLTNTTSSILSAEGIQRTQSSLNFNLGQIGIVYRI